MNMRSILWLCAFFLCAAAHAQPGWRPERPVVVVIGAAPGGANDRVARAIQRGLQDLKFANPVIALNKPGAGQTIAFSYLASHGGSPYFLGLASSSWLTTVAGEKVAVTHRDVTPIIRVLNEYQVYFVRSDSTIRSARDIVDRLKQDPGAVSFGFSTAIGNPIHISIGMLARIAGADPSKLRAIVFNTGTATAVQVAGGHLDVGVQSPGSAHALAQSGRVRLIAVAGPRRLPGDLANVPTLREQGIAVEANVFYTIFAPKGIEPMHVAYWEKAIASVMQSEQIRKESDFNRWTIELMGHRELPAYLDREVESYRRTLTDIGLSNKG
jgi:putative tricarboxylic transport membrane protein